MNVKKSYPASLLVDLLRELEAEGRAAAGNPSKGCHIIIVVVLFILGAHVLSFLHFEVLVVLQANRTSALENPRNTNFPLQVSMRASP